MIGKSILAAAAIAGLSVAAAAHDAAGPPPSVEHASADDCAIIVAIGKNQLDWGAAPLDFALYPLFDRKDGGRYIEDCRWSDYGVSAPPAPAPDSEKGFFVTRPVYSGTTATAQFQERIAPHPGPNGRKMRIFATGSSCTLEKKDGIWRIAECRTTFIT